MRYRLACLTHGPASTLEACLASFDAHVTPKPSEAFLHVDGPSAADHARIVAPYAWNWTLSSSFAQRGFCEATRSLWDAVAAPPAEFVFWLEHDFAFTRDVNLDELADVLIRTPRLVQMALVRGPANDVEHAAGGLVQARPDTFEPRETLTHPWLEHSAFWTTNPSLIPREVLDYAWPVEAHCEGLFSIQMREQGFRFGLWGEGTAWVSHIGARTGFGY